jgi:KipI family sensor histidine kinase inhibitor
MRWRDVVDGAGLVDFPGESEDASNDRAVALARAVTTRSPAGFVAAVPGATTLLLLFDPLRLSAGALRNVLSESGESSAEHPLRRRLQIPVEYGGPDLADLARERSLSDEEFSRLHAQGTYRVAFLGFAPGFAYLTGLAPKLHAPRLATPRTRVPAGSLAIGGPYTGIYPDETPGGWWLIGRSPVTLFDPAKDPPSLFQPGDEVSFERIDGSEFARRSGESAGASTPIASDRGMFQLLSPGFFTSVQGGADYRRARFGVPPGGAIDPVALAAGNARIENGPNAAALEIAVMGPALKCLEDVEVCLSGAEISAELNGRSVAIDDSFELRAGDELRLGRVSSGMRSYLCVRGGVAVSSKEMVTRRLKAGDLLFPAAKSGAALSAEPREFPHRNQSLRSGAAAVIRVVLASEPSLFREESVRSFLSSPYRVSPASDRRGIRLEGSALVHAIGPDIAPEATAPGAIQVPKDGMPILLGPDRPVTGGYAKVATVIGADLWALGQAVPGSQLRFQAVGLSEALEARVRMESR